jgi:hypothetical protein
MSKKLLHRCIEHLPLKIAVLHDVNIGGLGVGIFVIEKTLP